MRPPLQTLKRGDLVTLARMGAPDYLGIVLETYDNLSWPSAKIQFFADNKKEPVVVNQNLIGLRKIT